MKSATVSPCSTKSTKTLTKRITKAFSNDPDLADHHKSRSARRHAIKRAVDGVEYTPIKYQFDPEFEEYMTPTHVAQEKTRMAVNHTKDNRERNKRRKKLAKTMKKLSFVHQTVSDYRYMHTPQKKILSWLQKDCFATQQYTFWHILEESEFNNDTLSHYFWRIMKEHPVWNLIRKDKMRYTYSLHPTHDMNLRGVSLIVTLPYAIPTREIGCWDLIDVCDGKSEKRSKFLEQQREAYEEAVEALQVAYNERRVLTGEAQMDSGKGDADESTSSTSSESKRSLEDQSSSTSSSSPSDSDDENVQTTPDPESITDTTYEVYDEEETIQEQSGFFSSIKDKFKKVWNLPDKADSTIDEIKTQVDNTSGKLDNFLSTLKNMLDTIKTSITNFFLKIKNMSPSSYSVDLVSHLLAFIAQVFIILRSDEYCVKAAAFATIGVLAVPLGVEKFIKYISPDIPPANEAQGIADSVDKVWQSIKIIFLAIGAIFQLKVLPLFNAFSIIGRGITGIEKIFSSLKTMGEIIIDYLYLKWYGVPRSLMKDDMLGAWAETAALILGSNTGTTMDPTFNAALDNCIRMGCMMLASFGPNQSKHRTYMHQVLMQLKYRQSCTTSYLNAQSTFRVPPFVVAIHGKPGVGKTTASGKIISHLAKQIYDKDLVSNCMIYTRQPTEFWDQYYGQPFVLYDDFGQLCDSLGKPNPNFMDLISMANIAPFPLNMAHLEQKGNTFFNSQFVFCNMNNVPNKQTIKSLSSHEALLRRFNVLIESERVNKEDGTFDRVGYKITKMNNVEGLKYDPIAVLTEDELTQFIYAAWLRYYTNEFKVLQNVLYPVPVVLSLAKYAGMFNDTKFWTTEEIIDPTSSLRAFNTHAEMLDLNRVKDLSAAEHKLKNDDPAWFVRIQDKVKQLATIESEDIEKIPVKADYCCIMHSTKAPKLEDVCRCDHYRSFNPANPADVEKKVLGTGRDYTILLRPIEKLIEDGELAFTEAVPTLTEEQAISILECYPNVWGTMKYESINPNPEFKLRSAAEIILKRGCTLRGSDLTGKPQADTWWKSVKRSTSRWVNYLCVKIPSWLTDMAFMVIMTCVGGISGVLLLIATTHYVRRVTAPVKGEPQYYSNIKRGDGYVVKQQQQIRTGHPQSIDPNFAPVNDANLIDQAQKIARNNVAIYVLENDEWKFILGGFFLDGDHVLMPYHWIPMYTENALVRLVHAEGWTHEFKLADQKWTRIETTDSVVVKVPYMKGISSIVKLFVDDKNAVKGVNPGGMLIGTCRSSAQDRLPFVREVADVRRTEQIIEYRINSETLMRCTKAWSYLGNTSKGECGSLLLASNPSLPNKILGMHVCKVHNSKICIAVQLTREDIDKALLAISSKLRYTEIPTVADAQCATTFENLEGDKVVLQGDEFLEGTHLIGKYPVMSARPQNDIIPSKVHKWIPGFVCKTCPAALGHVPIDGQMVNVKMKALSKIGRPDAYVDRKILQTAINSYQCKLSESRIKVVPRILTMDEAIFGDPSDCFIPSINVASSAGIVWKPLAGHHAGKKKWIDLEKRYVHEELRQAVLMRLENAKRGIVDPVIFEDVCKVERRPIEKVALGKTRVFSSGPVDFTILFRMYFGTFISFMMHNRIDNESCVGMNPASPEWGRLVKQVMRSAGVMDGDFENYDGTQLLRVLKACRKIITWFYGDEGTEDHIVRRVLWASIMSSLHTVDGLLYAWHHSNPSGNPLTTILNTMFFCIAIRYIFFSLGCSDFSKNVGVGSFGDDNLLGISKEVVNVFNPISISQGFAKMGMVYTNAKKDGAGSLGSLTECTFLKRSFVCRDGFWMAPLHLDIILEAPCWTKKNLPDSVFSEGLATVPLELALHGEEVYDHYMPLLTRACMRAQIAIPEYESYSNIMTRVIRGDL